MVIYTHKGKDPQKRKGAITMAIFDITKDKNLIHIHRDDDTSKRDYIYNINTNTFTNAKTGRTVKTIPGLRSAVQCYRNKDIAKSLLNFILTYLDIPQKTERIKLYETIYNINPDAGSCHRIIADTDLKLLQAAVKVYSKTADRSPFMIFFETYKKEITRQKYSQILQVNNLSDNDIDFLNKVSPYLNNTNSDKTLRLVFQWWKNEGEWGNGPYGFATKVEQFLAKASVLSYTPRKLHFYEQFAQISIAYELYKARNNDEALLANWYTKFNLHFSNDLFEVIVPQNKQDFVDEATEQHNCVFRSYYPMVIDCETLVVFIRRKEDINKSFITCEINPHNGEIKQCLKKYNTILLPSTDKDACAFKTLYQTFLYEQFNSSSN